MPWCPNCKMEYREGISVCSDCNVPLVESLSDNSPWADLLVDTKRDVIDKFAAFLSYSNKESNLMFNEEDSCYHLQVEKDDLEEARKLFRAFHSVEEERMMNAREEEEQNNDSVETSESEEEETANVDGSTYVMKADQYSDNKSTGWMFVIFGIAGLIFVGLNYFEVIRFLSKLSCLLMAVVFLIFFVVAYVSFKKAKQLSGEIEKEDALTQDINEYLHLHVTREYLDSIHDDTVSEEINYFKAIQEIKDLLFQEFGEQNPSYIDRLVDEFYTDNFEG